MKKDDKIAMKGEIKAVWDVDELPVELDRLIDFQEDVSVSGVYSQEFFIRPDDKFALATRAEDAAFLGRLYPVGQANGTGSTYAVWDDDSGRPLGHMPVIVFGDEGGEHVVAENLRQLLRLLTCDMEISVDNYEASFSKDDDEDYEESEGQDLYRRWLWEEFSEDPISDPGRIIEAAQAKYQASFDRWMKLYHNPERCPGCVCPKCQFEG